MGACVHAYTRRYINFTMGPPIHIWPYGLYFNLGWGAPVCLFHSISRVPRLSLTPFDRRQNTTRASRVSRRRGAARAHHCLGCKFFACISIGTDRHSVGGTSCRPFRPFCARSPCLACHTDFDDKCTYLLAAAWLIYLASGHWRNRGKIENISTINM